MKPISLFFCLLLSLTIACKAQTAVNFDDAHIHYMGRVDMKPDAAVIS